MNKLLKISLTLFITLIIVLGFAMPLNPVGNWYQQFLPSVGDKQINDIIFLDSLTGFIVASRNVNPDTTCILKTTNGGDNWQIVFTQGSRRLSRVKFINIDTGFVCGGTGAGTPYIYKTTNAGLNWNVYSIFGCAFWNDMQVLSNDTIWVVDSDGSCGGVFRTTNGGINWDQQLFLGSQNPTNIYFYDKDTGYIAENVLYKTTNSGVNWTQLPTGGGFSDMYFVNALTGWKADGSMKKTTDGGLNWVNQVLPQGGIIITSQLSKFSKFGKDTIFGVGGLVFYGAGQFRGVIFKTTNGGNNWLFQVPDTAIHSGTYFHVQFLDKLKGWAYWGLGGIHTISGGDTSITGIIKLSSELPTQYQLYQNYPNPFNPITNIKYQIVKNNSAVQLEVYDVTGKYVNSLVNHTQTAGTYEVDFNGNNYSSGVYFYRIEAEEPNGNKFVDSKKMVLLK